MRFATRIKAQSIVGIKNLEEEEFDGFGVFLASLTVGSFGLVVSSAPLFYVKEGVRRYAAITELNRNVFDVFNDYGVALMTPSYQDDPAQTKVVKKESWYASPANPQRTPAPSQRGYPPSRP